MNGRVEFETGRLLSTADYVDDQEHHRRALRAHQLTQHRWGIAEGLEVVVSGAELVVRRGHAIDAYGRDLILESPRSLDLHDLVVRRIESIDVWLYYDETIEPSVGQGLDRVREAVRVQAEVASDLDPRHPVTDPDVRPGADPVPARQPWPVFLARVTRDPLHPDKPPVIDGTRRPYVGVVGDALVAVDSSDTPDPDRVWLRTTRDNDVSELVLTAGPPDGSPPGAPATLTLSETAGASLTCPLTVTGGVTVAGEALAFEPAKATASTAGSIRLRSDGAGAQLEVALPDPPAKTAAGASPAASLAVGVTDKGTFTTVLRIADDGTVTVFGNLEVHGAITASSVSIGSLTPEASAYLLGAGGQGVHALFEAVVANPLSFRS